MTTSDDFDMSGISFVKANGLNRTAIPFTKFYLRSGLVRKGVEALNLEKDNRLESLVLALQKAWGSAIATCNNAQDDPNEETEDLGAVDQDPETLLYGKGVTDSGNIGGITMVRAVKRMSGFVVDLAKDTFPGGIADGRQRKQHEYMVVAMFVEAIYGLQHDHTGGFREALLSKSLKKVAEYVGYQRQNGESKEQFQIRTLQGRFAELEDKKLKGDKNLSIKNHELKLENERLRDLLEHKKAPLLQQDGESDAQFQLRTLQDEVTNRHYEVRQLELELEHSKDLLKMSEDMRMEAEHKKTRRDLEILKLKNDVVQLEWKDELSELKIEDAEYEVKTQASSIKTRGSESRHLQVRLMR